MFGWLVVFRFGEPDNGRGRNEQTWQFFSEGYDFIIAGPRIGKLDIAPSFGDRGQPLR